MAAIGDDVMHEAINVHFENYSLRGLFPIPIMPKSDPNVHFGL